MFCEKNGKYVKENGEYVRGEELYSQYIQRRFLEYEENTGLVFHDLNRKNYAQVLVVIDLLKDVCAKELPETLSSSNRINLG